MLRPIVVVVALSALAAAAWCLLLELLGVAVLEICAGERKDGGGLSPDCVLRILVAADAGQFSITHSLYSCQSLVCAGLLSRQEIRCHFV